MTGALAILQEGESDGGKEDIFYFWDTKQQHAAPAPGSMGSDQKMAPTLR
jgi:hypothetical protein